MEKYRSTKIALLVILAIEVVLFFAIIFALDTKTVSNVFIVVASLGLIFIFIQYFVLKSISGQTKRNRVRRTGLDEKTIAYFRPESKKAKDGKYKEEDIISARTKRSWILILMISVPTIFAAIISIVTAMV